MTSHSFSGRPAAPLALLAAALLAACGGGGGDAAAVSETAQARSAKAAGWKPVPVRSVSEPALAAAAERRGAANGRAPSSKLYIVQLAEAPVLAYQGGVSGFAATKPAKGRKIDPASPQISSYAGHLTGRHDNVLASVGGKKAYSYTYAFNGFAAELSEAQAAQLAATSGVLAVTKDTVRKLDTATTPTFLGLTGAGGFYAKTGAKGEDIVIGIIDSGIWPEHPSFSDRTGSNGSGSQDGKLDYRQLPGWHGKCTPGDQFNASACNQKLIGARFYNAGWGGNAAIDEFFPYEFNSPRDFDGHGTHTASTAGGNEGVATSGDALAFGFTSINGIAPRARIASYKVCWGDGVEGGCFGSDSVAAIDQAVADGVDVLNFSISGTLTNFLDPVEVAFLFAADAGVFVAASAGNSGPATSTVAHPSPWLTTVAAGTHDRDASGRVTLGNGAAYTGASAGGAVASSPLIDAIAAARAGANAAQAALCFGAADGAVTLDPAKVAGKIVVCDRGVSARTNKSRAVEDAGGVGMILVNTSPNSLNADLHFVPTVHLNSDVRAAIKAYAATAGATASIAPFDADTQAPFTAAFSSRGPLLAAAGDLLKPDLIAPGQDILAGVAPPNYAGRLFDLLSGTSMSSPHVAGLAALFKEAKPAWSPMAIKSALMTTGYDVLDPDITVAQRIFRQGAGHVRPNSAIDPGLVFDAGFNDWLAFLCGTGQLTASYCPGIRIDPSDLNVASIAIGDLAGVQTVKRRVTNVGRAATYTASHTGLAGFTVEVPTLTLAAGETKEFNVTITRTTAPAGTYAGGQLTLSDGPHKVRVPMVVRPVALAAPAEIRANGTSASYDVTFGYDGTFSATARGLIPAAVTTDNVSDDPTDSTCSLASPNARKYDIVVPAGTSYARFATFDADVNTGSDLDLCVFFDGAQVGASAGGSSEETVNLVSPAAGTYTVVVQGWGVIGSTPFKLHRWLLGTSSAGNMTVSAPASATLGGKVTIGLTFSGLGAATKYLGSVAYAGTDSGGAVVMPDPTIVRIDTP